MVSKLPRRRYLEMKKTEKRNRTKNGNYVLYTLRSHASACASFTGAWKWESQYLTPNELINRIARLHGGNYDILANLQSDMSSTFSERAFTGTIWTLCDKRYDYYRDIPKYYIGKIINGEVVRADLTPIMSQIQDKIKVIKARKKRNRAKYDYYRKAGNSYEFRRDPVPDVHNYKWHRGSWYRLPATAQAKRKAFDYELKEYTGNDWDDKARNLPTAYTDITRHKDKSWKTSCKVRKQWEKHCRRHVDTFVIPTEEVEELDYE